MTYQISGTTVINDSSVTSFPTSISTTGSIAFSSNDTFQGTVAGYVSAGWSPSLYPTNPNGYFASIQRTSFTSDGNSIVTGALSRAVRDGGGCSSDSNGYHVGGFNSNPTAGQIEKFPFASNASSNVVGQMNGWSHGVSCSSSIPYGYGYMMGGNGSGQPNPQPYPVTPDGYSNKITRFPFAIETNSTLMVGTLSVSKGFGSNGHSSPLAGWAVGGWGSANVALTNIEKYTYATDSNATSVGQLPTAKAGASGTSSSTYGYIAGGSTSQSAANTVATIYKWPFTSPGNATSVGQLTVGRYSGVIGTSSTASGYNMGGQPSAADGGATCAVIDKFPFASDSNATSVGNLAWRLHNNYSSQQD
jgi:hypothetical protein